MINIVLFEPEIPANTGNIMRTCVAANAKLHLIKPLGFELDSAHIKRSGVNYIDKLEFYVYENFEEFKEKGYNTYKLRMAYQDIQDLEISLYPRYDKDKKDKYKISFHFLTPIIKFLKDEKEDDFNEIYMLENIIGTGGKWEFYNLFPSAKKTGAHTRNYIVHALRKDHPELPDKNNNTWKSILTEESYNSKNDWLAQCIENIETLKKYIKR